MKKISASLVIISVCIFVFVNITSGKNVNYKKIIIGTWKTVGENCNINGKCQKKPRRIEILTYKKNGTVQANKGFTLKYRISGNKITFTIGKKSILHTILSYKNGIMLIKLSKDKGGKIIKNKKIR